MIIPQDNFTSLDQNGRFTLFVNSETPPDKEVPLNHFKYSGNAKLASQLDFFRLYRIGYIQESNGAGVIHWMYDWKKIKIKPHCCTAFKQLCDSLASIEEFIQHDSD